MSIGLALRWAFIYERPVLTLNVICSLSNECKWQIRMTRCSQILPTRYTGHGRVYSRGSNWRNLSQSSTRIVQLVYSVASQRRRWYLASQAPINMIINSRVVHQTAHPESRDWARADTYLFSLGRLLLGSILSASDWWSRDLFWEAEVERREALLVRELNQDVDLVSLRPVLVTRDSSFWFWKVQS